MVEIVEIHHKDRAVQFEVRFAFPTKLCRTLLCKRTNTVEVLAQQLRYGIDLHCPWPLEVLIAVHRIQ
jgi:hypothetical protein